MHLAIDASRTTAAQRTGTERYALSMIRALLAQMMGLSFSVGAISQAQGKVAAALAAPVAEATRALSSASVLHMVETTYPREGTSNNWVWAAIQPKLAVFSVLPSRARYVIHNLIGEQPQTQKSTHLLWCG